nr:retrovirus-related Pol polyprotein from transposon TNT 1-94 [Tanacetum cinerariifolium]
MFWTKVVSTAYYVLNRVSITNPHNKTPYELLFGKIPNIRHLKPFGCQVTILNTSDHLGKFEGKANDGFLVGYAAHSKAYRVYNLSSKKVEETLNLRYLEDKPNVQGLGQEWYFDLDYLTDSLGYTRFKTNPPAGPDDTNIPAATLLPQSNIEIRRNLVPAAGDLTGGIVPTGGVPAGSDPASSVPTGGVPAGSDPASSVPTGGVLAGSSFLASSVPTGGFLAGSCFPTSSVPTGGVLAGSSFLASSVPTGGFLAGSCFPTSSVPTGGVLAGSSIPASSVPAGGDLTGSSVPASDVPAGSFPDRCVPAGGVLASSLVSTDFGANSVPDASVLVPTVVSTDSAATSPLPPVYSLGSCAHTTRFPSPSDLGNHQHTAGIFSSSSYDDDFCADVTNLDSNVAVDPVATRRINSIHPQS